MSTTSVKPWVKSAYHHLDELKDHAETDISADAEQSALGKLPANWSAVMEGQQVKADRQKGQDRLL